MLTIVFTFFSDFYCLQSWIAVKFLIFNAFFKFKKTLCNNQNQKQIWFLLQGIIQILFLFIVQDNKQN